MSAQAKEGLSTSPEEGRLSSPPRILHLVQNGEKPAVPIDLLPPPSQYDCALTNPETSESERPLARAEITADPAAIASAELWEQEEAAFQDFLNRTEELPVAPPPVIKV